MREIRKDSPALIRILSLCLIFISIAIPQAPGTGLALGSVSIFAYEVLLFLCLIVVLPFSFYKTNFTRVRKKVFIIFLSLVTFFLLVIYSATKNGFLNSLQDARPLFYYTSYYVFFIALQSERDVRKFLLIALFGIFSYATIIFVSYISNLGFVYDLANPATGTERRLTFGNGMVFIMLLPVISIVFFKSTVYLSRVTAFILFTLALLLMFIGESRSGIFTIALTMPLALTLVMLKQRSSYFQIRAIAVLFIILLIVPSLFSLINFLNISDRFVDIFNAPLTDSSVITRLFAIENALGHIKENPVFGVGFGQKILITHNNFDGGVFESWYIDSTYITLIAKIGGFGFLVYVLMFYQMSKINPKGHYKSFLLIKGVHHLTVLLLIGFGMQNAYLSHTGMIIPVCAYLVLLGHSDFWRTLSIKLNRG